MGMRLAVSLVSFFLLSFLSALQIHGYEIVCEMNVFALCVGPTYNFMLVICSSDSHLWAFSQWQSRKIAKIVNANTALTLFYPVKRAMLKCNYVNVCVAFNEIVSIQWWSSHFQPRCNTFIPCCWKVVSFFFFHESNFPFFAYFYSLYTNSLLFLGFF